MIRKSREKLNLFIARSPKKAVLVGILLFNIVFILLSAALIAELGRHMSGVARYSFWGSVFHTISMMLDAGCIESVIADVGKAGAFASISCLVIVLVGMVMLCGAIIGYVTNAISGFIESNNAGRNKLLLSDHIVIINWNSRAVEIINEFLYEKRTVKVIVFVPENREEIDREIRNRLDTTLLKETEQIHKTAETMGFFEKRRYIRQNLIRDRITCIVREGDVAAATDLDDICISKAKTVIILNNDRDEKHYLAAGDRGNIQTVKTLIQVSEISKANSNQTILVEVADNWTEDLVNRIISYKSRDSREKIIPLFYNRMIGVTNSQIAVMPEMNAVYDEMLSGRSVHFLSRTLSGADRENDENAFLEKGLAESCRSIPLTVLKTGEGSKAFFMAADRSDNDGTGGLFTVSGLVKLNTDYSFGKRSIIVLGHNSNMDSLMEGFMSYSRERKKRDGSDALFIVMVDDEESLARHDCYRNYPDVETINADIYDNKLINRKIREFYENSPEETTILILSDDTAESGDTDAGVLTYLIYIQEELTWFEENEPGFDRSKINVIVEIRNPKNEDIVKNYGADRVIISNRYLSRMISRICSGEAIYDFYAAMTDCRSTEGPDRSKEIHIARAGDFFEELPEECTAFELIRMIYFSGAKDRKEMLLGIISDGTTGIFFTGDQRDIRINLKADDLLVLFGDCIA